MHKISVITFLTVPALSPGPLYPRSQVFLTVPTQSMSSLIIIRQQLSSTYCIFSRSFYIQ